MQKFLRDVFSLGLLCVPVANASTLFLSPVLTPHQYQQTSNNPCVIGDPSCNNGGFPGPTIFPSSVSSYDTFSLPYLVSDIRTALQGGNTFAIGVDINQASEVQKLSLFTMSINGVVVDTYSADPATLVPPTVGGGNGNGYADYLLQTFTDLTPYAATDIVQFHVVMPLVNDGREEYFLIPTEGGVPQATAPEPLSFALVGSGLALVGLMRRRFSA